MKVVSPDEMAHMDRQTVLHGITDYALMEKAGTHCAKIIAKEIKRDSGVLIICGAGNNGGDGQVIARYLFNEGLTVQVLFTGTVEKMTPNSLKNFERLKALNIEFSFYETMNEKTQNMLQKADVIVDAVFGNGLKARPLYERLCTLFNSINQNKAFVYAIDIPSGLRGENGHGVGAVIRADRTLVIQNIKSGCLLEEGPDMMGNISIVDIGILECYSNSRKYLLDRNAVPEMPKRKKNTHKYQYGALTVIAGSVGMVGAGLMASTAALRSGVGLVTTYVEESAYAVMAGQMPWEVMVKPFQIDQLIEALQNQKATGYLYGPGVGRTTNQIHLLTWLMNQEKPVVIDADGLYHLSQRMDILERHHGPVVLTPHLGEFANLTGLTTTEIKDDPLSIGQKFSNRYQIILVLKGHCTLIFEPNGNVWFNTTGNPGMATAGSGDVLAGMIAGMIPQMETVVNAVKRAVYIHGLAGDCWVKDHNERSLTATDLITSLTMMND